ncbi:SDR family NAD(P)-dependent oxidoreductase [Kaistia nematophila]|uniref:SDR family oxidoreductase n=1 Tax=Kaistia nematophila TaxID=2994654 RepID=A0A9X3ILJ2_9HYPH|nr:SDR family oxidoreductase [Kaistia nematophila]MCX5568910.1 SDR family oxidoreductase [Kaistia nematophila]
MEVDIAGQTAEIAGEENAILAAVVAALGANGAAVLRAGIGREAGEGAPDILILSHPLHPDAAGRPDDLAALAEARAAAMVARGSGRIVHLVSAAGLVPMRRHPAWSARHAGAIAAMRGLAMASGPAVQVNAVAVGHIEPDGPGEATGDAAMLTHVPLGRAGTAEDVAHAVLFLVDPLNSYTTGQSLAVDGGWTTGYGRNF